MDHICIYIVTYIYVCIYKLAIREMYLNDELEYHLVLLYTVKNGKITNVNGGMAPNWHNYITIKMSKN